jgi:transcriptional regulator
MTTPADRLQGTVDVLILKALAWKPMHGYAIAQFLGDTTRGALAVEGAALYQGLHRLERKGLVRSRWGTSDTGRRVRVYALTPAGRDQLVAETDGWKRYASAVARVLAIKDSHV